MKKVFICLFLTLMLILILTGCANTHKVLHDSGTLRVEQDGKNLIVYDKLGNDFYTLTAKRVRKTDLPQSPRLLVNTDNVEITAQSGAVIVTDKNCRTVIAIKNVKGIRA